MLSHLEYQYIVLFLLSFLHTARLACFNDVCVFIFINSLVCFCYFQRYACGFAKICPCELERHSISRIPRGSGGITRDFEGERLDQPIRKRKETPFEGIWQFYLWFISLHNFEIFEIFTYFLDLGDTCNTEGPEILKPSHHTLI